MMAKSSGTRKIDLNTASLEELTELPGVGRALARRIIAARPYKTVRDLILVDGVGPKLYIGILPLITVSTRKPRTRGIAAPPPQAAAVHESVAPAAEQPSAPAEIPVLTVEQPAAPPPAISLASETHTVGAPPIALNETAEQTETETFEAKPSPQAVAESPAPPGKPPLRAEPQPTPAFARAAASVSEPPPAQTAAPRFKTTSYVAAIEQRQRLAKIMYGGIGLGFITLFIIALIVMLAPSLKFAAVSNSTAAPPPTRTPLASTGEPTARPNTTALAAAANTPTAPIVNTAAATLPPPTPLASTAEPTARPDTSIPPPTDTPAATVPAGAGSLVFAESFDPRRYYWGVGNTSFSYTEIRGGQLTIAVNRSALSYVFGGMNYIRDFYAQVSARPNSCGSGDHYGMIVRARDDANFYMFGVSCEGKARIQLKLRGEYSILADTPPSPAVNTDVGAVNLLAVRAVGSRLQFYANGQLLAEVTDDSFTSGMFGLYAKSVSTGLFTVSFDDAAGWSVP